MKKIILFPLLFVCYSLLYAQNFEIINQNTDAKLVIKGKPKNFIIAPFAICSYDSITYLIYQNWSDANIKSINNFEYSNLHRIQKSVSDDFKQKRCDELKKSSSISIVELPNNLMNISKSYVNDTLTIKYFQWKKYIGNIVGNITIKALEPNLKIYYGYGGIAGEDKKNVVIIYK